MKSVIKSTLLNRWYNDKKEWNVANERGWGKVYQTVTRNKNLSAAAKGVYAYLAAFCGISDECFPSVDTIVSEMGMGKDTFYRHINALVAAGVVEKWQAIGEDGKFGRTLYRLTHEITISEKSDLPYTENRDTDKPDTEFKETINNSIKKEQILKINNKYSVHFEEFWKVYPRKKEKAKAHKCYMTRLKEGYSEETLYQAAVNYAADCERQKTDERYIKLAATFIGVNTPFLDWIEKEGVSDELQSDSSVRLW